VLAGTLDRDGDMPHRPAAFPVTMYRVRQVGAIVVMFIVAALFTPGSSPLSASLGDVPIGQYYTEAVSWVVGQGFATGASPGCFAPEESISRSDVAQVLWRFSGRPATATDHGFTDVSDPILDVAISWMAETGITTGVSATTYEPDRPVQRGALAAIFWRLAGRPTPEAPHHFTDVTAAWQSEPVAWLVQAGITNGTGPTTFGPDLVVTRGQLATLLWRFAGTPPARTLSGGGCGANIDTSPCPPTWSDTAGLTPDTIRLGATFPLTGALRSFGAIGQGMEAWFDHVNTTAPVAGRRITLDTRDDGYDPDRTVANVSNLVDSGVFAIAAPVGTPHGLAINTPLNRACVPLLYQLSGHPAFGDPVTRPWSTAGLLSFRSEALLWGEHLLAESNAGRLPARPDVALFVVDNDLGAAYLKSFEAFTRAHGDALSIASVSRHSPNDPDVSDNVARLYDLLPPSGSPIDPDVVILMTSSRHCTDAIRAIDRSDWSPSVRLLSNTCASVDSFLAPAGESAGGWRHVSANMSAQALAVTNPGLATEIEDALGAAGLDTSQPNNLVGVASAVSIVEALTRAAQDPGGLSRTSLMRAVRTQSFDHPLVSGSGRFELRGTTDGYAIESGEVREYLWDGVSGAHAPIAVVEAEGRTGIHSSSNG